jgi:hypothetical protein
MHNINSINKHMRGLPKIALAADGLAKEAECGISDEYA